MYTSEPSCKPPLHTDFLSSTTARVIWRVKKKAAAAIIEKYRYQMQNCFNKWKLQSASQEVQELRNMVLLKVINRTSEKSLRKSINKFRKEVLTQKTKEVVVRKQMERWKKRFVLKVFKLICKHNKADSKSSKTTISRKKIKELTKIGKS
jgi:hypothetical protein